MKSTVLCELNVFKLTGAVVVVEGPFVVVGTVVVGVVVVGVVVVGVVVVVVGSVVVGIVVVGEVGLLSSRVS